jgi:hypothetical protein
MQDEVAFEKEEQAALTEEEAEAGAEAAVMQAEAEFEHEPALTEAEADDGLDAALAEVQAAVASEVEAEAALAEMASEAGVEAGAALGDAIHLLTDGPTPLPDSSDAPPGGADAPTLRIPGRVLHLYPVYGAYRASWVPNDYAPLCSIALAPHMIHDHRGKSYLSALRGVKAAAAAAEAPPAWVPFSEAGGACAVCAAPFAWQSTCRSAAQDVCAQHHCRACGKVVCGACSTHAACLPPFGIVEPARVCDACFWKL